MTAVKLQIGNQDFTAEFLDNASVQALLALLPLTLTMTELNGNEKLWQSAAAAADKCATGANDQHQ